MVNRRSWASSARLLFTVLAWGCSAGLPPASPPASAPSIGPAQTGDTGQVIATADTALVSTADTSAVPGQVIATADTALVSTADTSAVPADTHVMLNGNYIYDGNTTSLFIMDGEVLGYSRKDVYYPQTASMWWSSLDLAGLDPPPRQWSTLGYALNVGDVTGDGNDDLALYGADTSVALTPATHGLVPGPLSAYPAGTGPSLGPAGGSYPPVTASYSLGEPIACGDVSGDGVPDLCGGGGVDYGPPDGVQDVTFDERIRQEGYQVPALDLDGDGRHEIYWAEGATIRRVVPVAGVTETIAVPTWTGTQPIQAMAIVDFGAGPVLLVAMGAELCTIDGVQFDAGGRSTLAVPGGTNVESVAAGDFDGDGEVEVAVGHRTLPHRVEIFDLSGLLRRTLVGATDDRRFGARMVTGDLHVDGIADLLIQEPTGGTNSSGLVHYYRDPLLGY